MYKLLYTLFLEGLGFHRGRTLLEMGGFCRPVSVVAGMYCASYPYVYPCVLLLNNNRLHSNIFTYGLDGNRVETVTIRLKNACMMILLSRTRPPQAEREFLLVIAEDPKEEESCEITPEDNI
jgi:hypothetical protein